MSILNNLSFRQGRGVVFYTRTRGSEEEFFQAKPHCERAEER